MIEKQTAGNGLSCRSCIYKYMVLDDIIKTIPIIPKKSENSMGEDEEFKFAAICEKKCPRCDCEKAMFIEMQIRSADEPMTIFYQCTGCRKTWKE